MPLDGNNFSTPEIRCANVSPATEHISRLHCVGLLIRPIAYRYRLKGRAA